MKRHFNNFWLAIFNLATGFIAGSIIEYEISRIRKPYTSWIPTPQTFDLVLSFLAIILAIFNLSVLILIYAKNLENRQWLWFTTLTTWIIIGIIIVVLKEKFLPVVFP